MGVPLVLIGALVLIAQIPVGNAAPGASKVEMKKAVPTTMQVPVAMKAQSGPDVAIAVVQSVPESKAKAILPQDLKAGESATKVEPMDHPVFESTAAKAGYTKNVKASTSLLFNENTQSDPKTSTLSGALVPKTDQSWIEEANSEGGAGKVAAGSSDHSASDSPDTHLTQANSVQVELAAQAPAVLQPNVAQGGAAGTDTAPSALLSEEPPVMSEESMVWDETTAPAAMEAAAPAVTVKDGTPKQLSSDDSGGGEQSATGGAQHISVVVPCITRDVPLLTTLIESINAQTVQPHEVIVAISGVGDDEVAAIENSLAPLSTAPLSVLASLDAQPPGANRNRGVEAASSPRISFFDADDQMHPSRIEMIQAAFDTYNAKCVIHNFSVGKFKSQFRAGFSLASATIIKGEELYAKGLLTDEQQLSVNPDPSRIQINEFPISLDSISRDRYAAGNPSCTKDTLLTVKYGNDARGEDNMFLRSVLSRYGPESKTSLVYVGLPLTAYYPSDSESNQWARTEWTNNVQNPDFDSTVPSGAAVLALSASTPKIAAASSDMPNAVVEGVVGATTGTINQGIEGITLIIPCIARDVEAVPRMLKSVNGQTLLPREMIIATSGISMMEGDTLQAEWQAIAGERYTVNVLSSAAKMSAGENRNRAVPMASQSYISFFDADDEMLPTRLSVIKSTFDKYDAKCVIHSFELGHSEKHFAQTAEGDEHVVLGRDLYNRVVAYDEVTEPDLAAAADGHILQIKSDLGPCRTCIDGWLERDPSLPFLKDGLADLAAGNPSCRRDVLEAVPFNEEMRGEDAMFLRSILGTYGRDDKSLVFVNAPLTAYHPSDAPGNWWAMEEYKRHENDPDWTSPEFSWS